MTYVRPISFGYHVTGLAAAMGVRVYDAAGTALAARQSGVASESSTGLYVVRTTIDSTWPAIVEAVIDDGAGNIIARETIDQPATASVAPAVSFEKEVVTIGR